MLIQISSLAVVGAITLTLCPAHLDQWSLVLRPQVEDLARLAWRWSGGSQRDQAPQALHERRRDEAQSAARVIRPRAEAPALAMRLTPFQFRLPPPDDELIG